MQMLKAMKVNIRINNKLQPVLIAQAKRACDHSRDKTIRKITNKIINTLLIPAIIITLYFEVKLGECFDSISRQHAIPSELSCYLGFRMFEVHVLQFKCVLLQQESAMRKKEIYFNLNFQYLNKNLSRNIKKLKKEKITAGIDADCNKITKILKLLYAPLTIFLILVDPH